MMTADQTIAAYTRRLESDIVRSIHRAGGMQSLDEIAVSNRLAIGSLLLRDALSSLVKSGSVVHTRMTLAKDTPIDTYILGN